MKKSIMSGVAEEKHFYKYCLFIFLITLVVFAMDDVAAASYEPPDDASNVSFHHAVNSRDELSRALNSSVDFLEADILMGRLRGASDTSPLEPIMAHPPEKSSDLTFAHFVASCLRHFDNTKRVKGLKLDFKDINAVEPALKNLKSLLKRRVPVPVWINADILPGPGSSTGVPLQAETFLSISRRQAPNNSWLSVGWTTSFGNQYFYDWPYVTRMAKLLHCISHPEIPVTFPVRASMLKNSMEQLIFLLGAFPGSSLTVWSSLWDEYDAETLLNYRTVIPWSRIYYDLPPDRPGTIRFYNEKDSVVFDPREYSVRKDEWRPLRDSVCNQQPEAADGGVYLPSNSVALLDLPHIPAEIAFNIEFFNPITRTALPNSILNIYLVEDIGNDTTIDDVERSRSLLQASPSGNNQTCFYGKIKISSKSAIATLWNATCGKRLSQSITQWQPHLQTQSVKLDPSVTHVAIAFALKGEMEAVVVNVDLKDAKPGRKVSKYSNASTSFHYSLIPLVTATLVALFSIIVALRRT